MRSGSRTRDKVFCRDRPDCAVMFTRRARHEPWSAKDDELLRTMSHAGKSITLMTVKLNRPIASIKARAADIGVGIPGTRIGRQSKPRRSV